MGGIFISYRRDDATGYVHALRDRLATRFGPNQIFMDIDSIEPGLDFVEVIESSVASCDVVLALIGKRWLQQQRLQDPRDFVRLEIQAALARKVRVIPVLLEGMEMPKAEELPDALAPLSRRQAFEISNRHFSDDLNQLADLLGRILTDQESKKIKTLLPQKTIEEPTPIHIHLSEPSAQPLAEAQIKPRLLWQIINTTWTTFAWLTACVQAIIAVSISLYAADNKSYFPLAVCLSITTLLLFSALILRILKRLLAWRFFVIAGLWQFISLIGVLSSVVHTSNYDRSPFITAFPLFSLAFFSLAYRYRRLLSKAPLRPQ